VVDYRLALANYDLLTQQDTSMVFLLSAKDRYLLLTAVENFRWKTRFIENDSFIQDENDEFIDKLIERLLTMNDLCQLVADCINDYNSPARLAVQNTLPPQNGVPSDLEYPTLSDINDNTVLLSECDLAILYGLCGQLVAWLDDISWDFLEQLEVATNDVEKLELSVSAIPGLGQLPLDEALGMINTLQEDIAENYFSQVTESFKRAVQDELFCLAQSDCNLSFTEFADYFQGKIAYSLSETVWSTFVVAYGALNPSGDAIVYSMWGLLVYGAMHATSILGISSATDLALEFKRFNNDPDNDYIYAEECPCTLERTIYASTSSDANEGNWLSETDNYGSNASPNSRYVVGVSEGTIALGYQACISLVEVGIYQGVGSDAIKVKVVVNGATYYSGERGSGSGHFRVRVAMSGEQQATSIVVHGVLSSDVSQVRSIYCHYVKLE